MSSRENLKVCAIITTYRPDNEFPARVEIARNQVGLVIIVDDGDCPENASKLQAWFSGLAKVIVHHNSKNAGQAAALNVGVRLARQQGFRWLLTLDDDTLIRSTMVDRLLANVQQLDDGKPVGLVGMSWLESEGVPPASPMTDGPPWFERRGIITSGSLFSIDTYDAVGPFREDYVIGAIDYEFCLRARQKGFRIIQFSEVGFEQRLGVLVVKKWGPFSVKTYNYGAFRYYYGFRNNLMNVKKFAGHDPLYAGAALLYLLKTFFIAGVLEEDRCRKIRYMLMGFWHGLIGKMGKTIIPDGEIRGN